MQCIVEICSVAKWNAKGGEMYCIVARNAVRCRYGIFHHRSVTCNTIWPISCPAWPLFAEREMFMNWDVGFDKLGCGFWLNELIQSLPVLRIEVWKTLVDLWCVVALILKKKKFYMISILCLFSPHILGELSVIWQLYWNRHSMAIGHMQCEYLVLQGYLV